MKKNDKIHRLLAAGSEATGAAVGGIFGALLGGPLGAATGGIFGVTVSKGLGEFSSRILSDREQIKVGATAQFAIQAIKIRLDNKESPRDDDFFTTHEHSRSTAEEIFEGVLQTSRNEYEEKKLRLLGHFFSNLAFSTGVSSGEAHWLLRVTHDLSYRQICLMYLIHVKDQLRNVQLEDRQLEEVRKQVAFEALSLLQETYELYSNGLIWRIRMKTE